MSLGLPVQFAFIRCGDDFHHSGAKWCKIAPLHAERFDGRGILEFSAEETVTHASNLSLYSPEELAALWESHQTTNVTP